MNKEGIDFKKLLSRLLPMAVIYLAAIMILLLKFLPAENEGLRLEAQIKEVLQGQGNLERLVAEEPQLESRKKDLEAQVARVKEQVPTQYDLARVLQTLTELAAVYNLELEALDHVPIRLEARNVPGTIPLVLEAGGDQAAFAFALQMQHLFPTLNITDIYLKSAGMGQFKIEIYADLEIFLVESPADSIWQAPQPVKTNYAGLEMESFGLPFQVVREYLQGKIKVLGIVEASGTCTALIEKEGWIEEGQRLEEAVVTKITTAGVWLDVDGVEIKLSIGR
ncbi:MAG: hypothetical protein GX335_00700 [Firmicutes bacterium]|nr:hypothetical protein [Bacillota bacterium]